MSVEPALPPAAPLPTENVPGDGPLRPHQPNCFGCGPENDAGLHLAYVRDGDLVRSRVTLDLRHEGARGSPTAVRSRRSSTTSRAAS
jgi:hypothetical protein